MTGLTATASGAAALGLSGQVGESSLGSQFDVVWLRPIEGSAFGCGLCNVDSDDLRHLLAERDVQAAIITL